MKRLLIVLMTLALAAPLAAAGDNPWAAWPYRLKLRVTQPELADFTGLARARINLGPDAAKDWADVRLLDDKSREQPWRLASSTSAGDAEIVFYAIPGCRDYTLVYGNASAAKPRYDVPWSLGKVIIDDAVPPKAYTHGLWSWVRSPVLSGAYSHANTITDRFNYHGTSEIRGVALDEDSEIVQYVYLDPADTPEQIVLRLVFEERPDANSWEDKIPVSLYWGPRKIKDLPGRALKMGDLPAAGRWQQLRVSVDDLVNRTSIRWGGGRVPDLFGVEFCTDKGRAYWDLTTIGAVPAETEIVGLERAADAKPTFVTQRLNAFKIAGTPTTLIEARFTASVSEGTACAWDFGDGSGSEGREVVHVFEGQSPHKVTLKIGDASFAREVDLKGAAPEQAFGIELVSCPFIVRADDKALFNLRLEASLSRSLDVEARAVLLDVAGKELRAERACVTLLPGDKHPAFKAWSLDASAPALARVRFDMSFGGRTLATREVAIRSSREALDTLTAAGDRFLDASGAPMVIRAEVASDAARANPSRTGAPLRTLVVGRVPVTDFDARLKTALNIPGLNVQTLAVEPRPSWSMPPRLVLAVASDNAASDADAVLVASAWEMMLAGVPARAAAESLGVCVDQIRRRSKADVLLIAPIASAGSEDLARQYAVAIRLLGIEKDVPVVDLYSRSTALGAESPEVLRTATIESGVLTRKLHPRLADMTIDAIGDALAHPAPAVRSSE